MRHGLTENAWLRMFDSLDDVRLIQNSTVRDDRTHSDDLKRRHADLLTHRYRSDRTLCPVRCRFRQPAFLARKINVCRLSKAQTIDVSCEPFIAQPQAEFNGANIGRLLHNLFNRQKAKWLVVVDQPTEDDNGTHLTINDVAGSRQTFVNCRSN